MNIQPVANPSFVPDARRWTKILTRYRGPNDLRSTVEIAITFVPLASLWVLAWAALHFGYWWLSLLLAIPAAGFLVRLFMIQHDCGHGSFFCHRMANDWVGRVIGVLTLTPYDFWRRTHAIHHATSGHLERRGIGDVDTLTVREYLSRSFWGRLCYRAYRTPLVMFGLGPAYLFILQYRLPVGLLSSGWQPWLSTMATNVAIARRHSGRMRTGGAFKKRLCMAVRTMTFRESCAGSRQISASTMSITCAAVFPVTVCLGCSASIPNFVA